MGYKIGSFNMFKYQAYTSNDEVKKDLSIISNIIITEKLDIVALQEIFSKSAMDRMLKSLGSDWEGAWDSPNAKSMMAAEGYAFIWNKRRIRLAESLTTSGKRVYQPRIYNQYRINRGENQRELIRNPYFARFNPIGTFFEIRLINVHIMFSNSDEVNDISLSDAMMRKKEFEILTRNIYAKEADKRYGNNMPAYTFIVGDYNLNLNRSWTKAPYVDELIEIDEGRNVKRIRTVQDKLTTLKSKLRTEPNVPVCGYANNYDHFSFDEERFEGIVMETEIIQSVEKYTNNDFEAHRKNVSDHIPIYLDFELR